MDWLSWVSIGISLLAMIASGVSASEAYKANRSRNSSSLWSVARNDGRKTIALRNLSSMKYRKVVVTVFRGEDVMQVYYMQDGTRDYTRTVTFKRVKPEETVVLDFNKLGLPRCTDPGKTCVQIFVNAVGRWGVESTITFPVNIDNMYSS